MFEALGVESEPGRGNRRRRSVTSADPVPATTAPAAGGAPDEALLQAVQAATSVVKAHRMHGHLAARLDPLGLRAPRRPGAATPRRSASRRS